MVVYFSESRFSCRKIPARAPSRQGFHAGSSFLWVGFSDGLCWCPDLGKACHNWGTDCCKQYGSVRPRRGYADLNAGCPLCHLLGLYLGYARGVYGGFHLDCGCYYCRVSFVAYLRFTHSRLATRYSPTICGNSSNCRLVEI